MTHLIIVMLQLSSARHASRAPSRTPMPSLIKFGDERTVTIKQDLHDGRLLKLDEESVQMIKEQADPKTQKGGYGNVYFSKY